MTTSTVVTKILQDNLYLIFGESDPEKRLVALSQLWVPSSNSLFIDPLGIFRSHQAISDLVGSLHKENQGWEFKETGPVQILFESSEEDLRVARLPWSYGPPGEDPKVTGEDVATLKEGKIQTLYTFLDGGKS